MSRAKAKASRAKAAVQAELARVQMGIEVLECIRFTALYDNEPNVDIASAMEVAIEFITKATDRLDAMNEGTMPQSG